MSAQRFVACGMYAFCDELRQAWQALFDGFYQALPEIAAAAPGIVFESGDEILRKPGLLLGQTCGYPLVSRLHRYVYPVCVPVFDVPGTDKILYSSHFIVPAESDLVTLSDCRGLIVAINATDSNSGMNVLRHAIADLSRGAPFFARVDITGGHLRSVEAIAQNRAQLAAIDCISFQLIADREPQLVERVRSIGYSAQTCGLPFVLPGSERDDERAKICTEALRHALAGLGDGHRQRLHLERFEPVALADYGRIGELEAEAIEKGYAELK